MAQEHACFSGEKQGKNRKHERLTALHGRKKLDNTDPQWHGLESWCDLGKTVLFQTLYLKAIMKLF